MSALTVIMLLAGWPNSAKGKLLAVFFSRGWIAGALAVIYDKHIGYYRVDELECKMALAQECVFEVTKSSVKTKSTSL